jgi:6-phosphogluconolactonase (cycloisomerase 2 family)
MVNYITGEPFYIQADETKMKLIVSRYDSDRFTLVKVENLGNVVTDDEFIEETKPESMEFGSQEEQ